MQNFWANLWGIDQFFNIFKLEPKTKDLNMRLWVILTTELVGFIPQSLVLRSKKREFICS